MREHPPFQPGQTILLREIWQHRVWSARPSIVVQDTPELLAFYIPAGTIWKQPRALDDTPVKVENRLRSEWRLKDVEWLGSGRLRMTIPGTDSSVFISWNVNDGSHRLWYINLEDPLQRTPMGFDYMDQILDIVASPDPSEWQWKDENEFKEAVRFGLISSARAGILRREGEKAIAWLQSGKSPFNGWEKWRPDPSWAIPVLPAGWDII